MKPSVYIYQFMATPAVLSEICAGLEEEGVMFSYFPGETDDIKALAHNAANHSQLHVGIGINKTNAAMQIRNCPAGKPVFTIGPNASPADYRKLGTNAARAVKGGVFV